MSARISGDRQRRGSGTARESRESWRLSADSLTERHRRRVVCAPMTPCRSRSRHLGQALSVRPCVRATAPLTFAVALSALLLCAGVLLWLGAAPAAAVPVDGKPIWLFGAVKSQADSLTNQAGFVRAEIDALDTELERHTESY